MALDRTSVEDMKDKSHLRQASTATAVAGAATLNKYSGIVTSEALVTAAAATYTLTLTNSTIDTNDIVNVTLGNGTNSAGAPGIKTVTTANGSVVIVVRNDHAANALNGTLTFAFIVHKVDR